MAASEIYFRHVDWSKERPRLYDLLKELELNEDCLAGIVVWRENVPYVLCRSELAQSTVKLCRACHSENITPRALRSLMLAIKRLPPAEDICSKVLQELLEQGGIFWMNRLKPTRLTLRNTWQRYSGIADLNGQTMKQYCHGSKSSFRKPERNTRKPEKSIISDSAGEKESRPRLKIRRERFFSFPAMRCTPEKTCACYDLVIFHEKRKNQTLTRQDLASNHGF